MSGGASGLSEAGKRTIRDTGFGARYACPEEICRATWIGRVPGAAERKFAHAMLWLAAAPLRRGASGPVVIPIIDLMRISGADSRHDYSGARAALGDLSAREFGQGPDALRIFEDLRPSRFEGIEAVEFRLSPELRRWLVDPVKFGLIDLNHIASLSTPLDVALYERARLVANMRRPVFCLSLAELVGHIGVGGSGAPTSWTRIRPRIAGSVRRLAVACGLVLRVAPVADRFGRTVEIEVTVGTRPAPLASGRRRLKEIHHDA